MEQDTIWEAYQNDPELMDMGCPGNGRLEFVAQKVAPGSKILNIGVGSGLLESLLIRRGVRVSCLDPSERTIERVRADLSLGNSARTGYSQSIPFGDSVFDTVIMTEVLEHLDDESLDGTLREVSRVLSAGGRFIGSVPADENLAAGLVVCPKCAERFHRWGHVQSFSRERLSDLLVDTFGNVSVKRIVFYSSSLNWKGKLQWVLKRIQAGLGLRGGAQNFYFEAVKD